MNIAWCATCQGRKASINPPPVAVRTFGGRTKQSLFNDLCDLLGVARYVARPGSNPSRVFKAAATRAEVDSGSMPEVGAAIATKAGLAWGPECVSRGTPKAASVVTREGVGVLVEAMGILGKLSQRA